MRSGVAAVTDGGRPNQDQCGDGDVLIGLRGSKRNRATYLAQIQGVCGRSISRNLLPGGEVGIGIFTRSGDTLDALALVCDEFNVP